MKRVFFFFFFVFIFLSSHEQITKGNWLVGGSVSYASTNFRSEYYGAPYNYRIVTVNPNVGYFVVNKLATGLKIGIESKNIKEIGSSGKNPLTILNAGPFLRYYFLKPDKSVNIFSEAVYQYGNHIGPRETSPKSNFSFSAGSVAYFNTAVGLEFSVSYRTEKFVEAAGRNNTIQFGVGLQVHLQREE